VYVNNVIKSKLLESEVLVQQAAKKLEGTVRELAGSGERNLERDHGCFRSTLHHE
jgi:hypothetical protein